jgi:eukaryotic-like serine/threonine-protein kinase
MIARALPCRPHWLSLAMSDQLTATESGELSTHLETCDVCREQLLRLSGGEQWESQVRECLGSPLSIERSDEERDESEDPAWRDLLEPCSEPGRLGRIGKYEVVSLVGRGGFGTVFKAVDPELNRFVALKVLSTPAATGAATRKRFLHEARAAAAVVHDHVMPIHSVDTSGSHPYLVMPLLAGRSLQQRLDAEGTLAVEEVLRIALQTAHGLSAAHAQGLIHRDIKPANILLENGVERVRISDFGLARAVDDASQTQSGFIAGTPAYMAPEQARGESLDARADLFSLGSVMYAMCAGHPPFRAETTLAVLRRICDDEPRDVREHNASVPEWLWEIIARLLAKSPADRFQSAEEVADLLQRWLAHLQKPTIVPPPQRLARLRTKAAPRRATWLIAALATVAALLLPVALMLAWNWTRETPPDAHEQAVSRSQRSSLVLPDELQAELTALNSELSAAESRAAWSSELRYDASREMAELLDRLERLERELKIPLVDESTPNPVAGDEP